MSWDFGRSSHHGQDEPEAISGEALLVAPERDDALQARVFRFVEFLDGVVELHERAAVELLLLLFERGNGLELVERRVGFRVLREARDFEADLLGVVPGDGSAGSRRATRIVL